MIRESSASFCLLACSLSIAFGHEPGEILVGRTATNQLVPHLDFEQPVEIPRSIFSGIPGFATAEIGFESLPVSEPTEDLFLLALTADVRAVLTAIDSNARIYNGLPILNVGDEMQFGPPPFDYHPIFCIPSPTAVHGVSLTLRFVLRDLSGLYTDSDEFSVSITPEAPVCDSIDFNNDGASFDPTDIDAFLSAFSEGPCVPETATCNDIDFNNDGSLFDPCDINSFLTLFSEGPCSACGQ